MEGDSSNLRTAGVDAEAAHAASDAAVVLPERWRLVELLGSGGQATVWLAEDRVLGQRVALKILRAGADERTRARWLEEVRQGRRLSHPKLIRIFDVIEASERPVAVMEFVPGGTLADRVKQRGAQPVDDVARWVRQVLDVLQYLHGQRIVHRDVKPSNILVAEDGSVKLSDLGLVRSLDRASDLTATMEGVGTPRFMAPEQLRGEPPSPSCDLYSLGITMYQLLTGRLPFDGDSAFQIADAHLHAEPEPVRAHRPECPRWLARFVARLLEKDPRARYASAADAAAALEGRRVGLSRRVWRRLAAVLAVMVAGGGAALLLGRALASELDRVEVSKSTVRARSSGGRQLWSVKRPGLRANATVADLAVGPGPEAVIGWSQPADGDNLGGAVELELYSERGEPIRSIVVDDIGHFAFPDFADTWYLQHLAPGDFTGEGTDLAWTMINPRWFPSMVGVTGFRTADDRPLMSLANSGHPEHLVAADLDRDGRDEIIVIALNNRMGFQRTLVTVAARSRLTGEVCGRLLSPDITAFLQARSRAPEGCMSYTPLGSNALVVEPPKLTNRGIEMLVNGEPVLFDVWGNPEASPLFGAGGEAREAFWSDLATTCARLRLAPRAEAPFSLARLRADHPGVMSEPATEVAAALVAARALASGGHDDTAAAILRDAVDRFPAERDLQLRLGERLLIVGERDAGRDRLVESVNIASNGRNHNDQVVMLMLDAAVNGDNAAFEATRRFIANLSVTTELEPMRLLDVAWFFFQGEWSAPRLVDADAGRTFLWAKVLQAWARFEVDRDPAPALAVAEQLQVMTEVRPLARVLEARVLLAAGEARTAYELADSARGDLAMRCRLDYEACAWLPLAEWVAGRALAELGRAEEGRELLERAAERAPDTWIAGAAAP